jgi:hypothetical protein
MSAGTVVVFECLHTQVFAFHPPKAGELVWCPKCGDYKSVATAPHDFYVDCAHCTFHKRYGNAEITAETAAIKHAARRAGHRVVITDSGEEVRVFHHEVITVDVSVPPF